MPDNIAEMLSAAGDIPEVRILRRLARDRRIRFGIRGGVIRNLLVTFHDWEKEPPGLSHFVDAFSDINLIVMREEDWSPLGEAIAASVPFAGFVRWEADTYDHVLAVQHHFEHILVDRFVLWLDGASGPELSFGYIGGDWNAQNAWKRHLAFEHPAVLPSELTAPARLDTAILALLKLVRYRAAFGASDAVFDDKTLAREIEALGGVLVRLRDRARADVVNRGFVERLDFGVLDVLFSARRWSEAVSLLRNEFSLLVTHGLGSRSPILSAIADRELGRVARVGATVYRPAPGRRPRRRLHFERRLLEPEPPDPVSSPPIDVIPWTPVTVAAPPPCDDCCRYRDFELGSGVAAWRSPSDLTPPSRPSDRMSAMARVGLAGDDALSLASKPAIIPLPGIAEQTPTALVVRFDHGYVRARAGRGLTFELGVRQEWAP